jgi:hypothetical protein
MNKNPLLYLLSCMYRWFYFRKNTRDIAYGNSLGILSAYICINIATILIFLGYITPGENREKTSFVEFSIYCLPPYLILYFVLKYYITPEKKMMEMNIFSRDEDTDYFYVISYMVLSAGLFIYSLAPYIQ